MDQNFYVAFNSFVELLYATGASSILISCDTTKLGFATPDIIRSRRYLLYRLTLQFPGLIESPFSKNSPIGKGSIPCFALSSCAPGSSVTYNPGAPMPPVGLTTFTRDIINAIWRTFSACERLIADSIDTSVHTLTSCLSNYLLHLGLLFFGLLVWPL